jgi:serine/threonine protein kinase
MYSFGATLYELFFGAPPSAERGLCSKLKARATLEGVPRWKALQSLLLALLSLTPAQRPSAKAALQHEYFAGAEARKECTLCLDDKTVDLGIHCQAARHRGDSERHFLCRECFADQVPLNAPCGLQPHIPRIPKTRSSAGALAHLSTSLTPCPK